MTMIGADYGQLNKEFYYAKTRNLNKGQASRYAGQMPAVNQPVADNYVSERGNKCTDGNDDGKVGFLSAAGNVIEGVGKMAVNAVKGAIKHPFKTAAMIGACCIPVVGPVIAGGLATYGIASGTMKVAKGIGTAMSATSDAQAKDAWEAVGEGGATAGLSALALKGSAGQLKTQVTKAVGEGGSTTVAALKNAKASGASAGDLAKVAVKEGLQETASNAAGVAQATIQKGKKVLDKGKEYVDSAKSGTLKETVKGDVSKTAEAAGNKAKSAVDKAEAKYKEVKAKHSKEGKAAAKAEVKQAVSDIKAEAKMNGAQVAEKVNGFEVKYDDGTVMQYNKNGQLTKTIETTDAGTTTTSYNKDTSVKSKVETNKVADTTYNRTTKYDSDGNIIKESTSTKTGNKTESSSNIDKNTNVQSVKRSEAVEINGEKVLSETGINNSSGFSGTRQVQVEKTILGKTIKVNETHYYQNGQLIENPSIYQKAQIKAQTTNTGVYTNKAIDYQIPGLDEYTNPFLHYSGAVLLENQE